MRLIKRNMRLKRRRGMSFIDVIISLLITAMTVVMVLATISVIRHTADEAKVYTTLNIYMMDKLDKIHYDCYAGLVIDAENYNDDGTTSGIWADVFVTNVADGFGEPLYLVELRAQPLDGKEVATTKAFIRGGCIAYAP